MPSYIFTATISTEAESEVDAWEQLKLALERNKPSQVFDIVEEKQYGS